MIIPVQRPMAIQNNSLPAVLALTSVYLGRKPSKHAVPMRRTDMSLYALLRDAGPPERRFDSSLKKKVLSPSPRDSLNVEALTSGSFYGTLCNRGKGCSYSPTAFPPSMAVMLHASPQGGDGPTHRDGVPVKIYRWLHTLIALQDK